MLLTSAELAPFVTYVVIKFFRKLIDEFKSIGQSLLNRLPACFWTIHSKTDVVAYGVVKNGMASCVTTQRVT
ncbi:MAG: hypothetical protein IPK46_14155 [Saprospiraceae bacterium]|nr:hypothetical protein [Saprospiraceae bacterium]